MSTTRVMAIALATVVGFLSTAPTLAADEGGTFINSNLCGFSVCADMERQIVVCQT